MTRPLRIAVGGFFLECNRWAPVSTAQDFARGFDAAGAALAAELRASQPRLLGDSVGFMAAMDRHGPWELVPLRMAGANPGGPADHAFFVSVREEIEARLRDAGPVDGVFLCSHGAALTTEDDDPDGDLFARVRAVVGEGVPVVATLDLHANVSRRMCEALSACVAYRTNPHVDLRERGEEAAAHLLALRAGGPGVVERVQLPLVPPATSQLVAPGQPLAELIELGQQAVGGDILNVSVFGGFALADCGKCGLAVVVTARGGRRDAARAVALDLAREAWARRARFDSALVPLPAAVAAARAAGEGLEGPCILADVADNPGGGGGGNTIALLRALVEAGVRRAVLGVFTDAALAAQAHALGAGARFEARFNRGAAADEPFAPAWSHPAQVLALGDGVFTGVRGMVQGTRREMGPSALLQVGGVQVAVISSRQQLLDPAQLSVLGVDLSAARVLAVKSRGHFRAAFGDFAPADRILEVDCPGLTTPNLRTLPWTRLPRPVHPIDENAHWAPPGAQD